MIATTDTRSQIIIHIDPQITVYAVSPEELNLLESSSKNSWKDFCLVTASIGIPCLINAIHDTPQPFTLDAALFLNYLVGVLCILLAIFFGILWKKSSKSMSDLIQKIKDKPKHEWTPTATSVGALPSNAQSSSAP